MTNYDKTSKSARCWKLRIWLKIEFAPQSENLDLKRELALESEVSEALLTRSWVGGAIVVHVGSLVIKVVRVRVGRAPETDCRVFIVVNGRLLGAATIDDDASANFIFLSTWLWNHFGEGLLINKECDALWVLHSSYTGLLILYHIVINQFSELRLILRRYSDVLLLYDHTWLGCEWATERSTGWVWINTTSFLRSLIQIYIKD